MKHAPKALLAVALAWAGTATAALSAEEEAALARDVALYGDGYACNEEPLADRLRASALLALAGRGRPALDVIEARQRFLDGLRQRMKAGRTTAAACDAAISAIRTRLGELEGR